jgi:hypothetical protein
VVACAYHPSYTGRVNRWIKVQASQDINTRSYLKSKSKKVGDMAQLKTPILTKNKK